MTRRLLLGYLGVTLFVLAQPRGSARSSRTSERSARDLTANVSHDATVLAADAEDAVQRPTQRQLDALAAIAAAYTNRTGGRVVIVNKNGRALVDTSGRVHGAESFASRPEIRAALAGRYPTGVRDSKTLHESCSTSPCRSPPAGRCTARFASRIRSRPSTPGSRATGSSSA